MEEVQAEDYHKLPGSSRDQIVYKAVNPFSEEEQEVMFFIDPPHLLKTICNCFQSPTRSLWVSVALL